MRASRPAIVHLLGAAGVGPLTLLACRRNSTRLIVTVHDLPPRSALWNPVKAIACGNPGFLLADRIVVHGTWSARELFRRFGRSVAHRTVTMDLGDFDYGAASAAPDELRVRFGLPSDRPIVLFFGSLRRDKGLDLALEALASVPDVSLFVVAHEPSRAEPSAAHYERLAAQFGVASRVVWKVGWLPDDQVADIFAASDLVVLPYRKTFSGQSAVLRVAKHYGIPVIGSNHGEVGLALSQMPHCVVVSPDSPPALAEGIREMTSRITQFGVEPERRMTGTDAWSDLATSVLSTYREMLQMAPPP